MNNDNHNSELAEAVRDYAGSRPSIIGSRRYDWLKDRGWVEEPVPSGVRWKSPHNDRLYTISVAMHLEREVIRWNMYDLAGWDEDAAQR